MSKRAYKVGYINGAGERTHCHMTYTYDTANNYMHHLLSQGICAWIIRLGSTPADNPMNIEG